MLHFVLIYAFHLESILHCKLSPITRKRYEKKDDPNCVILRYFQILGVRRGLHHSESTK